MIDIHTLFGKTPHGKHYPVDSILEGMKRFGTNHALVHSLKSAYYSCTESESELLSLCREHPQLLPVAGADLRNNLPPAETVIRLKNAGFSALHFFTEINGVSLDTPLFREWIAAAETVSLPVFTGAPAEMVLRALRPMGRLTVPLILLGQDAYSIHDILGVMREQPNLYLEIRGFNAPGAMEYLAEHAGIDRLLFGSRTPVDYFLPTFSMIASSGLSTDEQNRILDGNARRIFHIPEGDDLHAAD